MFLTHSGEVLTSSDCALVKSVIPGAVPLNSCHSYVMESYCVEGSRTEVVNNEGGIHLNASGVILLHMVPCYARDLLITQN